MTFAESLDKIIEILEKHGLETPDKDEMLRTTLPKVAKALVWFDELVPKTSWSGGSMSYPIEDVMQRAITHAGGKRSLAKDLGVSYHTVWRWFKGYVPLDKNIARLEHYLLETNRVQAYLRGKDAH